jgi:formylmethanofuran dehydrogenase subunit E
MIADYQQIIEFHGHSCPGLAMGYRMAAAALDVLNNSRAEDKELVAIVENDACGVDALQCLSGCTFGKGNLLFRDYGKQVYTVYSRVSRKGVRVSLKVQDIPQTLKDDREQFTHWLLNAPQAEILTVETVPIPDPEPARVFDTSICESCGEGVMETRTRQVDGKSICIPCATKRTV